MCIYIVDLIKTYYTGASLHARESEYAERAVSVCTDGNVLLLLVGSQKAFAQELDPLCLDGAAIKGLGQGVDGVGETLLGCPGQHHLDEGEPISPRQRLQHSQAASGQVAVIVQMHDLRDGLQVLLGQGARCFEELAHAFAGQSLEVRVEDRQVLVRFLPHTVELCVVLNGEAGLHFDGRRGGG